MEDEGVVAIDEADLVDREGLAFGGDGRGGLLNEGRVVGGKEEGEKTGRRGGSIGDVEAEGAQTGAEEVETVSLLDEVTLKVGGGREGGFGVSPPQHCLSAPDLARHSRRRGPLDVAIRGKDLNVLRCDGSGVEEEGAAAVVPALARLGRLLPVVAPRRAVERELYRPRPGVRVVLEAGKDGSSTGAGEKREFSSPDDLERGADLECNVGAGVVGAGADAEVPPALFDPGADAVVCLAREVEEVGEVATAGKDEEGAGVGPGFVPEGLGGDGLDVVAVGEEGAEGAEGAIA